MLLAFMNECCEVGLDESGRGPGFGRLYAAAVIWPKELVHSPELSLIQDSKKIKSVHKMEQAYTFACKTAVEWAVAYATEEEVTQYGPLEADMIALHRALDKLILRPEHILMDGNYFKPYGNISYTTVIKGDDKYQSIAAASIIAKWTRDQYIRDICIEYPLLDTRYGLSTNKGYLTQQHRDGIVKYGISEFHRKKYKGCAGHPVIPVTIKIKPMIVLKLKT
jgi:ribonuclease HII